MAKAPIMDSCLKEFTVSRIDKGKNRLQARAFSDEAEACPGLKASVWPFHRPPGKWLNSRARRLVFDQIWVI
ncbi:MAG: hypothetical protein NDI81_11510 [Desulfobacula sp.]|nr:hypothetical protein [Desulfobacula sp.]